MARERTGTERAGRERKSLIEPVLAPAGEDVLSRIIANDRARRHPEETYPLSQEELPLPGGEAPHPETASPPGDVAAVMAGPAPELIAEGLDRPDNDTDASNERTNVTTLQRTNVTRLQVAEDGGDADPDAVPPRRRRRGTPAPGVDAGEAAALDADVRAERLGKALGLAAADEVAVVTVRVSTKLNEYMDRYVDRLNRVSPKRRYRKQDAVAEAFAAFFADHPLPPAPAEEEI